MFSTLNREPLNVEPEFSVFLVKELQKARERKSVKEDMWFWVNEPLLNNPKILHYFF